MLCKACQAKDSVEEGRQAAPADGIPDQLCSRCGELIGHEDIERRARKKHLQLEQFGLTGKRRSLLKPKDRRG